MKQTKTALMAYGIDSACADRISETYTIKQLKEMDLSSLLSLGLSEEIAERLLHTTRPPIPEKNAQDILLKSAFTCCICRKSGLPVVIHHIDSWEHSHSHAPDNLAVLCLNHHGEAHTHHDISRNLTAQMIRQARDQWYECVKYQHFEAERALKTVRKYQGRWDYLNLSYICGYIDDHKIQFNSQYKNYLIQKGLISRDGMIDSEKLTETSTHWLDFFDGQYLRRYIEEMLNIIIDRLPVRYINSSMYLTEPIRSGDLLLVDGRCDFRQMNNRTKGQGQTRKVKTNVNHLKITGEFDAWYCNSSSSHSTHLTGSKQATLLCLVRNVERVDGFTCLDCTVIGLGLNLTQPDLMEQLMGNTSRTFTMGTSLQDMYEQELDAIADIARGEKEQDYYFSPPDVCDICHRTFRTQKYMIDGATKPNGAGACMCAHCYRQHGTGIGWGRGQLYLNQGSRWLMVGGFADNDKEEVEEMLDEEQLLQLINCLFPPAQTE